MTLDKQLIALFTKYTNLTVVMYNPFKEPANPGGRVFCCRALTPMMALSRFAEMRQSPLHAVVKHDLGCLIPCRRDGSTRAIWELRCTGSGERATSEISMYKVLAEENGELRYLTLKEENSPNKTYLIELGIVTSIKKAMSEHSVEHTDIKLEVEHNDCPWIDTSIISKLWNSEGETHETVTLKLDDSMDWRLFWKDMEIKDNSSWYPLADATSKYRDLEDWLNATGTHTLNLYGVKQDSQFKLYAGSPENAWAFDISDGEFVRNIMTRVSTVTYNSGVPKLNGACVTQEDLVPLGNITSAKIHQLITLLMQKGDKGAIFHKHLWYLPDYGKETDIYTTDRQTLFRTFVVATVVGTKSPEHNIS